MRAINHAMTGATIGLLIGKPVIALLVAFFSHFVCDVIPHHGLKDESEVAGKNFVLGLLADAAACFALVLVLASTQPQYWVLAAICAFLAASPDFLYVQRWLHARGQKEHRMSRLEKLTVDIQWFQRPIGAVVEVAWFIAGIIVLKALINP